MPWIYLDNNATTQPAPEVVAAMHEAMQQWWANPSSVHRFGQAVRQRVELARQSLAALIGCKPRDLVLTSGGTESNNLALRGALEPALQGDGPGAAVLLTTKIEHSAIREPAEALAEAGVKVVYLATDALGRVAPAELDAALAEHVTIDDRALVSIQWANNETGILQPAAALGASCQAARQSGKRVLFHTDATQAVGKLPVDVKEINADLLTFSAHKFHGPKGAGGLFMRTGVRLRRQNVGGPQEREKRGGTENTAGIIGAGVAAELAQAFVADAAAIERLRRLRDRFEDAIGQTLPDTVVNSRGEGADQRLWNTSNLGFPRLEAEAILLGLSERGLCASAGAACSSGSLEPSPVLLAMGVPEIVAHGSVRFSLSRFTTDEEIDQAIDLVPRVVARLLKTMPMGTPA